MEHVGEGRHDAPANGRQHHRRQTADARRLRRYGHNDILHVDFAGDSRQRLFADAYTQTIAHGRRIPLGADIQHRGSRGTLSCAGSALAGDSLVLRLPRHSRYSTGAYAAAADKCHVRRAERSLYARVPLRHDIQDRLPVIVRKRCGSHRHGSGRMRRMESCGATAHGHGRQGRPLRARRQTPRRQLFGKKPARHGAVQHAASGHRSHSGRLQQHRTIDNRQDLFGNGAGLLLAGAEVEGPARNFDRPVGAERDVSRSGRIGGRPAQVRRELPADIDDYGIRDVSPHGGSYLHSARHVPAAARSEVDAYRAVFRDRMSVRIMLPAVGGRVQRSQNTQRRSYNTAARSIEKDRHDRYSGIRIHRPAQHRSRGMGRSGHVGRRAGRQPRRGETLHYPAAVADIYHAAAYDRHDGGHVRGCRGRRKTHSRT